MRHTFILQQFLLVNWEALWKIAPWEVGTCPLSSRYGSRPRNVYVFKEIIGKNCSFLFQQIILTSLCLSLLVPGGPADQVCISSTPFLVSSIVCFVCASLLSYQIGKSKTSQMCTKSSQKKMNSCSSRGAEPCAHTYILAHTHVQREKVEPLRGKRNISLHSSLILSHAWERRKWVSPICNYLIHPHPTTHTAATDPLRVQEYISEKQILSIRLSQG